MVLDHKRTSINYDNKGNFVDEIDFENENEQFKR